MAPYVLNSEAMRVVERNERGNVTYRKRYRKGDEVDTSHMDEAHVASLVEDGLLVESEDDLSDSVDAGDLAPTSGPFGAATGEPGDATAPEESGTEQSEDDDALVDEYSSMDYAQLQKAAKDRDLSAGGSADDLRARLRADDADES